MKSRARRRSQKHVGEGHTTGFVLGFNSSFVQCQPCMASCLTIGLSHGSMFDSNLAPKDEAEAQVMMKAQPMMKV